MPKDFVAVGRGTLSKIWCQTISNVLGINLILTEEADASLGAAMLAGIGAGSFRDFEDAVSKCVHYTDKVEPDVSLSNFYKQQFKRFKLIHEGLVEMSKSLSKENLY